MQETQKLEHGKHIGKRIFWSPMKNLTANSLFVLCTIRLASIGIFLLMLLITYGLFGYLLSYMLDYCMFTFFANLICIYARPS